MASLPPEKPDDGDSNDPIEATPPREPAMPPPPSPPKAFSRRTLFRHAVILATGGLASSTVAGVHERKKWREKQRDHEEPKKPKRRPRLAENRALPSAKNWSSGEFTANKVQSWKYGFLELDKKHVLFIDQNGNIIGGKPIRIPDSILAQSSDLNFKNVVFPQWANEVRNKLADEYSTIFLNCGEGVSNAYEEPTLVNVRTAFSGSEGESMFETIWAKSQRSVSPENPVSRYKFVKNAMENSPLPPELKSLFIGICGVESQFSELAENSVRCAGPWQINREEAFKYGLMRWKHKKEHTKKKAGKEKKPPSTALGKAAQKILKKLSPIINVVNINSAPLSAFEDERDDFAKSTKVIIKLFEDCYAQWSKENPDNYILKVQQQYHLSNEDFLYPAIVTAYFSGGPGLNRVMKWFFTNKTPADVAEALGPGTYGQDLYTFITSIYPYSQEREHSSFGKKSRDYVIKVMAMRDLLEDREQGVEPDFDLDYAPPTPDEEPEEDVLQGTRLIAQKLLDTGHPQTALIGGITGLTAAGIKRIITGTATRRKFMTETGLGLAAAYGGSAAGRFIEDETRPCIGVSRSAEEEIIDFAPYTLDESGVRKELLKKMKGMKPLDIKPQSRAERKKLRDPLNKGLNVIKGARRFRNVKDIAKTPGIVAVPEFSSPFYRLRGVGNPNNLAIKNDVRYAYCYESTEHLIRLIDDKLNQELHAKGFPEECHVRLIITSLSRDEQLHKLIKKNNKNAAPNDSPHMGGHTFDIHRLKYDIIDKEDGKERFCMLTDAWKRDKEINKKLGLVAKLNALLGRILIEMKEAGAISVIRETGQDVYHISDMHPRGKT